MRGKKAILNVLSSLVLQIVVLLSGFIVRKIIIQVYGSDINGLISSITQFLGYITLLESGVGPVIKSALYKPIANKNNEEISNILFSSEKFFKKIAKIFIVYLLGLAFIYPVIVANQVGYWFTFTLVLIISISTFAEYYFGMTYKLLLQSDQKSYIVSIIQIVGYIINLIMVVILAKFNCNIHILKLVTAVIYVIRPITQNLIVKKLYNIDLKNANKDYVLKQKWDGLAQHIAAVIHTNTDMVLLTFASTLKEVSIYSVYSTVTNGLRLVVQSFNEGIESMFGNMMAQEENDNLRNRFGTYEIIFFSVIAILYSCAFILITPFVKVYTLNITDLDYCRPLFGYILIIGEFIWALRQPYNNLIKSAGRFKETRIGAWIEAGCNIIISLVLINKFGLVGIAMGTMISMIIRTTEFIYYANKHILNRKVIYSIKKIIIMLIQIALIIVISKYAIFIEYNSYISWGINAFIVFAYSFIIILICNLIVYPTERRYIFNKLKNFRRKN